MSTEKKLSDILREELDNLKKKVASLENPSTTSTEVPREPGHKDVTEAIDNCPHCKAKAKEKLAPEILREQREKQKSMKDPKLCEDCGEILDGERNETCPNCRGTHF
jgi:hypothetical protein